MTMVNVFFNLHFESKTKKGRRNQKRSNVGVMNVLGSLFVHLKMSKTPLKKEKEKKTWAEE